MKTVSLLIGNSDNKLTQQQWSEFCHKIDTAIKIHSIEIYFYGCSCTTSPWQNAAWTFAADDTNELKALIYLLREAYNQDAVAWVEGKTEFI